MKQLLRERINRVPDVPDNFPPPEPNAQHRRRAPSPENQAPRSKNESDLNQILTSQKIRMPMLRMQNPSRLFLPIQIQREQLVLPL